MAMDQYDAQQLAIEFMDVLEKYEKKGITKTDLTSCAVGFSTGLMTGYFNWTPEQCAKEVEIMATAIRAEAARQGTVLPP